MDIQSRIDRVAACGPIKAWSVIVTVLGDLCAAREDSIGAPVLNALIGRLGISAQASRVAIHRLKRDGWVRSHREGRGSFYRLSPRGWDQTQAVRPRIYSPAPPPVRAMLIAAPAELAQTEFAALLPPGAAILAPRTALVPEGNPVDANLLACPLTADTVPAWVHPLLVDPELLDDYAALARCVDRHARADDGDELAARTALRLAVLHHWRRLCLRHTPLAEGLMPDGWPGELARRVVTNALDRLPRPDLPTLTRAVVRPD